MLDLVFLSLFVLPGVALYFSILSPWWGFEEQRWNHLLQPVSVNLDWSIALLPTEPASGPLPGWVWEEPSAEGERLWSSAQGEAREFHKNQARTVLERTRDVSCDAVAEAFGLSAATVRGLSPGGKRRSEMFRSKYSESSSFTRDELLSRAGMESVVWR